MEGLILIETGQGGHFARPAIEYQLTAEEGALYGGAAVRLVDGSWDTYQAHAGVKLDALKLQAQIWHNEDAGGTIGAKRDTVVLGASYRLKPVTLTLDWSPDAFQAGERTRLGVQAFERYGRASVWVWATTRYLHDRRAWDEEYWAQVNYDLSPRYTVGVRRFESDYFGDSTTLRLTVRK
jgi:hypothetical protein